MVKRTSKHASRRGAKNAPKTAWHLFFIVMLREDGSPSFEVRGEVQMFSGPPRADAFLLRRKGRHGDSRAKILRRLWRWIDDCALVEFKSDAAPIRRGDLSWWLALVHMQQAILRRARKPERVQGVFVVVRRTPTLRDELASCGLKLRSERGGYYDIRGSDIEAKLVVLTEVELADREPLLGLFSKATVHSPPVSHWLHDHFATALRTMGTKLTAADRKLVRSFIATLPASDRLAGLAPEQRLAGLAPEQRLAGLAPEQVLRTFAPEQRLAGLAPEQRLAGLAPEQLADAIAALPLAQRGRIAARFEAAAKRRNGHPRPARKQPARTRAR